MPLTDQLEERASRKLRERDEKALEEQNKDQAFFRRRDDSDDLYDIESQRKKNERH